MVKEKRGPFARQGLMPAILLAACVWLLFLFPVAYAAPEPELTWQGDLSGDGELAFFAEQGTGKLILFDFADPPAGAAVVVNVVRNSATDQLQITFNEGLVEARFLSDNALVIRGKQSDINCCNPLSISIAEGKLNVVLGEDSRTMENVAAFQGSLTVQSVTGRAAAYRTP